METRAFRQHALLPKRRPRQRRTPFIPAIPSCDLGWIFDRLRAAERAAMAKIVAGADIVEVDGKTFIFAPVDAKTLDTLAAFGAEAEDRENDLEDEPGRDEEPDDDNEPTEDPEPEECDGDVEQDQFNPSLARTRPVTTMPEPPPIAEHAKPVEFDREPGPRVSLERDKWSEQWRVRDVPEPAAAHVAPCVGYVEGDEIKFVNQRDMLNGAQP